MERRAGETNNRPEMPGDADYRLELRAKSGSWHALELPHQDRARRRTLVRLQLIVLVAVGGAAAAGALPRPPGQLERPTVREIRQPGVAARSSDRVAALEQTVGAVRDTLGRLDAAAVQDPAVRDSLVTLRRGLADLVPGAPPDVAARAHEAVALIDALVAQASADPAAGGPETSQQLP